MSSVYEAVGGMAYFEGLVDRFYGRVAGDDVLLALYPDQVDLGPAKQRLTLFLAQYWGGPTTYSDERGHPRLRMRHFPFVIGVTERDHWIQAMAESVVESEPRLSPELEEELIRYFVMAAEAMRNQD